MKSILLLFTIIGMASCQQGDDSPCFTPPEPFRMVLLDNDDNDLLVPYREAGQEPPRLYYRSNGVEKSIPFDIREGNPSSQIGLESGKYYLESADLPWISFDEKVKVFYLEHIDATDTLEVEVQRTDYGGQCQTFYEDVAFNGTAVEIDSTDYVYVMRR